MVNNLILAIALLTSMLVGFFIALKSVQLGLKWQIQLKDGKEPKLDNPITKVVETIQTNKIMAEAKMSNDLQEKIHEEWLFGKVGE